MAILLIMATLIRPRDDAPRAVDPIETVVLAEDNTPLAARFYPPGGRARGVVLVVGAMGVPQTFYAPFARWLAAEGFYAATFDFRGMGLSRRGSLRGLDADILTWAEQDTAAVLRALQTRARGLPITWIGHSLGGQILPFVPEHSALAKVITVAAGSGYWRQNAAPLRRKVWLFWFFAVPLATPLFGYFPGKRLGMVGDLPRGVVRQWKKWCMNRDYAASESPEARAQYARVAAPITSISFTDDEMMSGAGIESIHALHSGAPRTMRRFTPADVGVTRIGHFGFFRAEMQEPLWERILRGELAEASS